MKTNYSRRLVCLLVIAFAITVLWPSEPSKAGFGGFMKKVGGGALSVAQAPFKGAGTLLGPGIKAAFDPAMDGACDRLKQTADYAASRMGQEMDVTGKKLIAQMDADAKSRLEQLDNIMSKQLNHTDEILTARLSQFQDIGTSLLDKQAKILDANLTREDQLLQTNVAEFKQVSEQTLTRAQNIETDSFDRLDAAMQDSVPFAASQVMRQIQFLIVVIVPVVVLMCLIVWQLFRGVSIQRIKAGKGKFGVLKLALAESLDAAKSAFAVGIPVALMCLCVHVGFRYYYYRVDRGRVERLVDAAQILERADDYQHSQSFRRRAVSLDTCPKNLFYLERAKLLAVLVQSAMRPDLDEAATHLTYIENSPDLAPFAKDDGNVIAARLYLAGSYGTYATQLELNDADLKKEIDDYMSRFLVGKSPKDVPELGKLVLVTVIRRSLDNNSDSIATRLSNANDSAGQLVALYPKYAAGKATRAQLLAMIEESKAYMPEAGKIDEKNSAEIDRLLNEVAVLDPLRIKALKLSEPTLDDDLAKSLYLIQSAPAADKKTDKYKASLANAAASLDLAANSFETEASQLVSVPWMAKVEREEALLLAIRKSVGEQKLSALVTNARATLLDPHKSTLDQVNACLDVALAANDMDLPNLAEAWLSKIPEIANGMSAIRSDPTNQKAFDDANSSVKKASLTQSEFLRI